MCRIFLSLLLLIFTNSISTAQHEGHGTHAEAEGENKMAPMSHFFSLNLPMTRNGSGTSWLPDASPMYAIMKHSNDWMFMFHGAAYLRYTSQNLNNKNERGDASQFDLPNWFMGMAQRRLGERGLFGIRLMMSLDRFTVGGDGYPLLFQSGETFEGKPLVDRQHPHDLFSELAIGYTHMVSPDVDVFIYLGYPGEPAVGPPAFMHRISSMPNPDAPLAHHWQDATHIVYGVGTLGARWKWIKLDGSIFTGREPDEDRLDFDKPKFDSYSYRISVQPINNIGFQFSQAWLKKPEVLHPKEDVTRYTASLLYTLPLPLLGRGSYVFTSAVWGLNIKENEEGHTHSEASYLTESVLQWKGTAPYIRYEYVQKSSEELLLEEEFGEESFNINAFTFGVSQQVFESNYLLVNLGVQTSLNVIPERLEPMYGKNPVSGQAYIRLVPGRLGTQ